MKKLTPKEFHDRADAIIRARKIFMPHFTKNITIAFEIYQGMLAEQERDLTLGRSRERDYNILMGLQRPLCPDCGKELALRIINIPKGKDNLHGHRSSWICEDPNCCYEKFSKKDLTEWLKTLKKKEAV